MRLIANGTQGSSTLPARAAAVGTPGYAKTDAPAVGVVPTNLYPDDINIVLAELMAILSAAGLAPDNTGADTGQVLKALRILGLRLRLTGATTFYVNSSTGNDSNIGTSGAPFATRQAAWNYIVRNIDANNQPFSIAVADGTYTDNLVMQGGPPGLGPDSAITWVGNTGTPANCILAPSAGDAITVSNVPGVTFDGFKIAASAGNGLVVNNAVASYKRCNFGACGNAHLAIAFGGAVAVGDYAISGGGAAHTQVDVGGFHYVVGRTVTLTGTPAFSIGFAHVQGPGKASLTGNTFSGSATGPRYVVEMNGVLNVSGATLPGSTSGSTASGGEVT